MADEPQQSRCHRWLKGWSTYHASVFVLTFTGYAFFHATRKTFSNVKETISQEWTPQFHNDCIPATLPDQIWNKHHLYDNGKDAEYFLGILDTLFLFSYAVGLYISGALGDRYDMRKVLSFGMCASAVSVIMFGVVSEWLSIYNRAWYVIFWTLNGLLQSSGWPAMVAVMANWFGKSSRGLVLGMWSSCASVGNIIGSLLVSSVLKYGYEYAFLVPGCMLFAGGVIIFFGLVPHPHDVGLASPEDEENAAEDREPIVDMSPDSPEYIPQDEEDIEPNEALIKTRSENAMSFIDAVKLPGVIPYSLSYAALKLVNYSFFFWLPFYLTNVFNWTQADSDKISVWYDVGGIIAGIIAGFISDRMKVRAPVVVVMLILAIPSLFIYSHSPDDKKINSVLMGVTGFWIGGPANLISSAISADLGRQGNLKENKEAMATVAGIVDGTGSFGGGLGQILVPLIQLHLGWHYVFYMFILMMVITCLCILPIFIRELQYLGCTRGRCATLCHCCSHQVPSHAHIQDGTL